MPSSAAPKRGRKPSIAVLPFINRSGESEDNIFANCMVEDLTAALSLSRRMKVIAASATSTYRQGARDLRRIGRELGVRYLLEGNVRRAGDDLRVTAQLVEAEDGDILWTQKFDRPLAELSALQEELVTEVAGQLGVEVQRVEMEHALRKPDDISAWQAVMRSDAHLIRANPASSEAAVAEAKRAIEIDPGYAAAYAVLTSAQNQLMYARGGDDPELAREMLESAQRASALEPDNPLVLCRIAPSLVVLGKEQEALRLAERAVAINPNLENGHLALGAVLLKLGRWDECIAEYEAAERLAPKSFWGYATWLGRSIAHCHAGRLDAALDIMEHMPRLKFYPDLQIHRIYCLARTNRSDDAHAAIRGLRETNPELTWHMAEKFARNMLVRGLSAAGAEDYVATVRRLWAETGDIG